MPKTLFYLGLVLLSTLSGCAPLPLAFGFNPKGEHSLTEGQIVGVRVGMDRNDAREVILQNPCARYAGTFCIAPGTDHDADRPALPKAQPGGCRGDEVDYYVDYYNVSGFIAVEVLRLIVSKEHVIKIEWYENSAP